MISNARYTIRDSDGGEGGATRESTTSNARYVIGNGGIFAACYEGVGGCFNNRIAIFTTIIYGITTFNYHGSEGGATRESRTSNTRYVFTDSHGGQRSTIYKNIISNARYAFWNSDGGEGGARTESLISNARYAFWNSDRSEGRATIESIISNACYTIWDSDGGQGGAKIEGIIPNARYVVGSAFIGDDFGDGGGGETRVIRRRPFFLICHLYGIRCRIAGDVVVEVARLEVIRPKGGGGKEGEEEPT